MHQKIILTLSLFFIIGIALAQPPIPPPTTQVPIDGGLSLLLAAGAAYGAKKVYDFRNKDGQDEEDGMR
jgi:hypothetical protein